MREFWAWKGFRGLAECAFATRMHAQTAIILNAHITRPPVATGRSPLLFDLVMETFALLVRSSPDLKSVKLPSRLGWDPYHL
jgi:hypothetical protein